MSKNQFTGNATQPQHNRILFFNLIMTSTVTYLAFLSLCSDVVYSRVQPPQRSCQTFRSHECHQLSPGLYATRSRDSRLTARVYTSTLLIDKLVRTSKNTQK